MKDADERMIIIEDSGGLFRGRLTRPKLCGGQKLCIRSPGVQLGSALSGKFPHSKLSFSSRSCILWVLDTVEIEKDWR
jgi:hypothetical protein